MGLVPIQGASQGVCQAKTLPRRLGVKSVLTRGFGPLVKRQHLVEIALYLVDARTA